MRLEPVAFRVDGDLVQGDLYQPEGESRPPVVIMGHGFGAERRFRLPAFAEGLCMAGLAVLLFDYRGFGDSEGTPRGLVDAGRHLADFAAAVRYTQELKGVDGARLALWGTSFSGGHALVTAARLPGIAAVVAQVPHVDGLASAFRYPLRLLPAATWRALRDLTAAALGREPVRVPIVGRAGVRCLAAPDCYEGYHRLIPPGAVWQETVPARILLTLLAYRPVRVARRIQAPVLIIAAEQDSLIPLTATRKTAARIARCQFEVLPVGHFDLYEGPWFERSIALQIAFLRRHLGLAG
ncbi:MAG: alpha/beta hydrolase [Proteobacteria bacterium]|nr:alpha/beta hydrolase [Pseudomonadota bacterium]